MIKGVIFDLDGTLLDTISDIGDSVNAMLEDYGYKTHSYAEYKLLVGHGFKDLVKKSLPAKCSFDIEDEALNKFVYYYSQNYLNNSYPYEGIVAMLKSLSEKGIKLAINSNKDDEYVKKLAKIRLAGIEFIDVYGHVEGIEKKPDPTLALKILNKMDLDPNEAAYIGDSNTDIKTGQNAGMITIGVDWGFRGAKELEDCGADHIAYKPEDIIKIIQESL